MLAQPLQIFLVVGIIWSRSSRHSNSKRSGRYLSREGVGTEILAFALTMLNWGTFRPSVALDSSLELEGFPSMPSWETLIRQRRARQE